MSEQTLTEFLLARIAEDEAVANHVRPDERPRTRDALGLGSARDGFHSAVAITSGRVLAECKAKRQIVASTERAMRLGTNGLGPSVLRELAAVYADHSDYDESWRD